MSNKTRPEYAQQLVDLRISSNLSQVQFSELVGISVRKLASMERGESLPRGSAAALLNLLLAGRVSMGDLWEAKQREELNIEESVAAG